MTYFTQDNWNEIAALGVEELQFRLKEQLNQYSGFNLQATSFTESQLKILFEVLKENETITSLNLSDNNIGEAGGIAIAEALKENKTITSLDLGGNDIGAAGGIAIAEASKENKTITSLNLSDNNIEEAGGIAIAEALKENKTITSLDLSGNDIREAGGIAIAKALKENKTITSLNLGYNKIREAGGIAIAEALKENQTITSLNLGYNNIREAVWIAIVEALKENKTITSLNLSKDYITDKGAIELIKLLENNKSILEITLHDDTSISPDKREEINFLNLQNQTIFREKIERLYKNGIDQSNFRSFMQLLPGIKVILNIETSSSLKFTVEEQEKMKSLMDQAKRYKQDNFLILAKICKKTQLDKDESDSLLLRLPHELICHITSFLSFKDIKSPDEISQEVVIPQRVASKLLDAISYANKSTLER
ncbi:leucine-rich repeat domain-containing protein [Candidatus Jidaibacter acanthamoebae]|nr:hypothetical protein [Candidatus Jidaibacter acanthamoeba]